MTITQSRMSFHTFDSGVLPTVVRIAHFAGQNGVEEYHLTVRPTEYGSIRSQLTSLADAYRNALAALGLESNSGILRRFFCSDPANQAAVLESFPFANPAEMDDPCAVSWVGQPPAPPAKVALWAYHIRVPDGAPAKSKEGASLLLKRDALTHCWTTGLACPSGGASYAQTGDIFRSYEDSLRERGLSVADNVLRTWLFVRNIDTDYAGLVTARREFFTERGLTPETHYIASTGIAGASADISANIMLDAYAIAGVRREQIHYLQALSHLCPTHVYGVTFERGVAVDYQDRTHVTISGTASIDSTGSIVHPGNVRRQLEHTLENVQALLQQAGATLDDVCIFIVYLRDPSDIDVIQQMMEERFGETPLQVVLAPVCRPGWLVEVECEAIVHGCNAELPAF